jgi:hypothetical protein
MLNREFSLVISYGITNGRTIEVATDMVIPGHEYHNNKNLEEYYRVEVLTVWKDIGMTS